MSYQHIGQHSEASMDYYRTDTKPATPMEYNDLFNELKSIYDDVTLKVQNRLNYDKHIKNAW